MTLDDVRGDAVSMTGCAESAIVASSHSGFRQPFQFGNETGFATKVVATGPRLSHNVPTLPVRAERVVMFDSDIKALIDADDRFVAEMPPTLPIEVEPFPHPNAGTQLFTV